MSKISSIHTLVPSLTWDSLGQTQLTLTLDSPLDGEVEDQEFVTSLELNDMCCLGQQTALLHLGLQYAYNSSS